MATGQKEQSSRGSDNLCVLGTVGDGSPMAAVAAAAVGGGEI